MADEAAAAAAVQDAGNGEAKVSKNALKKQVMRLPSGRLQPFLFPSRNFFPTEYVRTCKHRFSMNVNTETVLTLSVIVYQVDGSLPLSPVDSRYLSLCPSPCSQVLQILEAACNPLVAADCRHLSGMQGRNGFRATIGKPRLFRVVAHIVATYHKFQKNTMTFFSL